jgi:hypothetical protein
VPETGGFESGQRGLEMIGLVAEMINYPGRMALDEFVHRPGGIAGPDDFHARMTGVRAELQVDVLRGVEYGFAQLVAQGADKFPGFIRPADGESEVVEFQMRIGHGGKDLSQNGKDFFDLRE